MAVIPNMLGQPIKRGEDPRLVSGTGAYLEDLVLPIAQGVGQALFEEVQYDASGQLMTSTLGDYALPRARDFPQFELETTETLTPRNPLGAKGIGEAGTIGSTSAVVNAVVDALRPYGVTAFDMPANPEKVWKVLHNGRHP